MEETGAGAGGAERGGGGGGAGEDAAGDGVEAAELLLLPNRLKPLAERPAAAAATRPIPADTCSLVPSDEWSAGEWDALMGFYISVDSLNGKLHGSTSKRTCDSVDVDDGLFHLLNVRAPDVTRLAAA